MAENIIRRMELGIMDPNRHIILRTQSQLDILSQLLAKIIRRSIQHPDPPHIRHRITNTSQSFMQPYIPMS